MRGEKTKNFILGLLIVAIVGFLLFMYIRIVVLKLSRLLPSFQLVPTTINWTCGITNIDWTHISIKHIQTYVS